MGMLYLFIIIFYFIINIKATYNHLKPEFPTHMAYLDIQLLCYFPKGIPRNVMEINIILKCHGHFCSTVFSVHEGTTGGLWVNDKLIIN